MSRRDFMRGTVAGATLGFLGLGEQQARAQANPSTEREASDPQVEALRDEPLPQAARIRRVNLKENKLGSKEQFSRQGIQVINIWAEWCSPCLKEMPKFTEVAEQLDAVGIHTSFILDSWTEDPAKIREIMQGIKDPQTVRRLSERLYIGNLKEELKKILKRKMKGKGAALGLPITIVVYDGKMRVRFRELSDEELDDLGKYLRQRDLDRRERK